MKCSVTITVATDKGEQTFTLDTTDVEYIKSLTLAVAGVPVASIPFTMHGPERQLHTICSKIADSYEHYSTVEL